MMTQDKWDAMTQAERYNYVSTGKKELKSIQGANANDKVGQVRVSTYYWVEVGGVQLSNRYKKEVDAYAEAESVIESMNPAGSTTKTDEATA